MAANGATKLVSQNVLPALKHASVLTTIGKTPCIKVSKKVNPYADDVRLQKPTLSLHSEHCNPNVNSIFLSYAG